MLIANQDDRVIQKVTIMILRTRVQQAGTGIFYHTDLRREVLVPIGNTPESWLDPRFMGHAGLSSNIGGAFTQVPEGMRKAHLFSILGTIVETDGLNVSLVEGTQPVKLSREDVEGQPCNFEILDEDLKLLQEQNQMSLLLTAEGFVQFNAQDYGEGTTADGRDRNILQGSFWCTPQRYMIGVSRPTLRSAAHSEEEVREILNRSKEKNTQRALSARAQSWANRAERDERRAREDMPSRRGTNTHIQVYQGGAFGIQNRTL